MINHCKACDAQWDADVHVATHTCNPETLALKYGGDVKQYQHIQGNVDGWYDPRRCSSCEPVASRLVTVEEDWFHANWQEWVWCAEHVGQWKGYPHTQRTDFINETRPMYHFPARPAR